VELAKGLKRTFRALTAILVSSLFLTFVQPAIAEERKKPNWLASCPEVIDTTPQIASPKTIFLISPSGQPFKLLSKDSTEFVTEAQSVIGCYVFEDYVINPNTSPDWQIGSMNRDSQGFYFRNKAGTTWRLALNTETLIFETEPGSLYYTKGAGFRLDEILTKPTDCKMKDFFRNTIRLGFPRNSERVPPLGATKNLILVVDFPDAALTQNLNVIVDDVIAPKVVENFYAHSSNGKFKPTFEVFPKVIRLSSLEKSFAPNSTGGFLVNGVMQDHRLVQEAVALARTQGNLDGYVSINVFAPTANSMGYYGSAFGGLPISIGTSTVFNSQLVGGTIGTIRSSVPSWKVFAHEYGHLLGMYDYYIHGSDGTTGKSPGPFDLMGNTSGASNTFLGYQRWVQGWVQDSEVICDYTTNSSVSHSLTPLNQNLGKKLYVHPINASLALVIEFRVESEFDKLAGNDGLLVYLIDMKVGSGKGSISIQPSEEDKVLYPSNDVQRYSQAPLSTGQTVQVNDLIVVAENVSKVNAKFKILTSAEYKAKKVADTKAPVRASTVKKSTITCVKGTLNKKVTSLKPKCPSGYKLKK
jgi:M6 family metalloprotease-like protein